MKRIPLTAERIFAAAYEVTSTLLTNPKALIVFVGDKFVDTLLFNSKNKWEIRNKYNEVVTESQNLTYLLSFVNNATLYVDITEKEKTLLIDSLDTLSVHDLQEFFRQRVSDYHLKVSKIHVLLPNGKTYAVSDNTTQIMGCSGEVFTLPVRELTEAEKEKYCH